MNVDLQNIGSLEGPKMFYVLPFRFRAGKDHFVCDDQIVAKRVGKVFRAYEANHDWSYSHYHGGQTHQVSTRLLRDLNGDAIQASTLEELTAKIAKLPFIESDRTGNGQ